MAEATLAPSSNGEATLTRAEIQAQREPERSRQRRANRIGCAVTSLLLTVTGFFILDDQGLNLWGDGRTDRIAEEMRDEAQAAKAADFATRSPEYQFSMDFLTGSSYSVEAENYGSGLIEFFHDDTPLERKTYDFGSDCLADTSYDTRLGRDASRAAKVEYHAMPGAFYYDGATDQDVYVSDVVTILPANKDLDVLKLKGVKGDRLVPYSSYDIDILRSYGCDPNIYEFAEPSPPLATA